MIGQISASNQLRTSCELAPNMFGASSELASVMEFGFNCANRDRLLRRLPIDVSLSVNKLISSYLAPVPRYYQLFMNWETN